MTTVERHLAAVVLAAGRGSRFDGEGHKLRVLIHGTPLVCHAVNAAVDSGIGPVLVVVGSDDFADILAPSVSVLRCADWEAGQARSLAAAIAALDSSHVSALVVGLADMPGVGSDAWRQVADAPGPIAVATFGGHRSPPAKLDRSVWSELPVSGDQGARVLMNRHPELVTEVPVDADGGDVDTLADLL